MRTAKVIHFISKWAAMVMLVVGITGTVQGAICGRDITLSGTQVSTAISNISVILPPSEDTNIWGLDYRVLRLDDMRVWVTTGVLLLMTVLYGLLQLVCSQMGRLKSKSLWVTLIPRILFRLWGVMFVTAMVWYLSYGAWAHVIVCILIYMETSLSSKADTVLCVLDRKIEIVLDSRSHRVPTNSCSERTRNSCE